MDSLRLTGRFGPFPVLDASSHVTVHGVATFMYCGYKALLRAECNYSEYHIANLQQEADRGDTIEGTGAYWTESTWSNKGPESMRGTTADWMSENAHEARRSSDI